MQKDNEIYGIFGQYELEKNNSNIELGQIGLGERLNSYERSIKM
jgi:hypothetical protein